jgi:hypothetical protein
MYLEPTLPRYQLAQIGDRLEVTVAARRSWPVLLFLCLWLTMWSAGFSQGAHIVFKGTDQVAPLFMGVWLTGWTIGGLAALSTILWQLVGKEHITADHDGIAYRVAIFGIGRTRSYGLHAIGNLRAVDFAISAFHNQNTLRAPFFGTVTGPIAFDYGAKTVRIGASLDEAEARSLVTRLREQLPASAFAA